MAEPNLSELVTTTLRKRSSIIADNVSRNNALLSRLQSNGNVKPADGGRTIVQPLIHTELANFQWYSGYETLDVTPTAVVDAAEFNWKQCAANVVWSGLEVRVQNAGTSQQIDLLEARMQAAEITMANQVSTAIYTDGTGTSGKEITGLGLAVSSAPNAIIYGGINASAHTFWRNQATDRASISVDADKLEQSMRTMWLSCTQGGSSPDLIVMGANSYSNFWSKLVDIQRVTESTQAVMGFSSLKFVTADVVYDGDQVGVGTSVLGTSTVYFLTTQHLFFRPHTNTNFTTLDERTPFNQDANNVPLVFAGNLTCNQKRVQGILYGDA